MPKVNRYRIYPTKAQVTKLNDTRTYADQVYANLKSFEDNYLNLKL